MDLEKLAEKIFAVLKGNGLKIKIYDTTGTETTDPTAGVRFFAADPNILVTINPELNHVEFSKGGGTNQKVEHIASAVRRLADEFMLNTRTKVFGKAIRPKDYSYQAKAQRNTVMENTVNHLVLAQVFKQLDYATPLSAATIVRAIPGSDLNEVQKALNRLVQDGKVSVSDATGSAPVYSKKMEEAVSGIYESFSRLCGGRRTSRQELEDVRIIVRHNRDVDDSMRGARSRNISAIFLEHAGRRIRFTPAHLGGARAMAQHLAQGGSADDAVGTYISESTQKLVQLKEFARYAARNQLINEDTQPVLRTVKAALEQLSESLRRLAGARSYATACARVAVPGVAADTDFQHLQELFTRRYYDQRLNNVLPLVQNLLEQQDKYRSDIEAAANATVYLNPTPIKDVPVLEFASETSRLGYKITELALRIANNPQLTEFVASVGTRLARGSELDVFEAAIISRVLENSVVNTDSDTEGTGVGIISECLQYERTMQTYDLRFL